MIKLEQNKEILDIFNRKGKVTDKVEESAKIMLELDHDYDFGTGDIAYTERGTDKKGRFYLESHLFIHKIMPYGFILNAVVSKVHYGDQEETLEREVSRVYELEYNLRDKVAVLIKNGKPLNFSENNISNMFSGHVAKNILEQLDTMSGSDMYVSVYERVSRVKDEQIGKVSRFFERLMKYNKIELIYKSGVPKDFALAYAYRVVVVGEGKSRNRWYEPIKNVNYLDKKQTNPTKHLGIPKSIFKIICEGGLEWTFYQKIASRFHKSVVNRSTNKTPKSPTAMKKIEKEIAKLQQAYARFGGVLYNLYQFTKELDEQYGISHSKDIIETEWESIYDHIIAGVVNDEYNSTTTYDISMVANLDFYRTVRYLYYQVYVEQGLTSQAEARYTYRDYLRAHHYMNAVPVKYPKALKTAHDIINMNYRTMKDEVLNNNFASSVAKYKDLEEVSVRGNYVVKVPDSVEDLTKEGSSLHHCVATYARQVAEGSTHILFMRDKQEPDISLVTFEVKNNKLVQARGLANRELTNKEQEFLDKWLAKAKIGKYSFV